jgi:tetratricopeptide (TPR) repeat protein
MACTTDRSTEIGDLSAGRLDAQASGALLDHLERCGECSAEFDLVADLLAAADREGPALFARGRSRIRLVHGASALLAAAAAVLLAVVIWRPGPGAPSLSDIASTEPIPAASALLRSEAPSPRPREYLEAMDSYGRGDYAGAAGRLVAFLEGAPADALANLYLGVCRLQTGDPGEAIAPLRRAAEGGDGLLRERALWYLGNAHLAAGDGERAREVFDRLAALGGDYEPNAREKLRAIRDAIGR